MSKHYQANRGDLAAVMRSHSATAINGPTVRREEWGLYKVTGVNLQGVVLRAERADCPPPWKVHPFPERCLVVPASTVGGDVDAAIRAIYRNRSADFQSVDEVRSALREYLSESGLPIPMRGKAS